MNKGNLYKSFVTAIILILISSPLTVLNVKAQTTEIDYPIIEIISPTNNTTYNKNTTPLTINITLGESTNTSLIAYIPYQTSWNPQNTTLFIFDSDAISDHPSFLVDPQTQQINKLYQTLNLTDIPEGNHNLTIYTKIWHYSSILKLESIFFEADYYADLTQEWFSNTILFSIDTIIPTVTFPSLENKTYTPFDVTINCTINEKISQLTYSLDEQEIVNSPVLEINNEHGFSVVGKPVLTNLSDGEHSIVFYATDKAGNVGVSETLYFIVDAQESFPTIIVLGSMIIIVVLISLVYFKKYKK